jgi:peptidoglycan/xylan/chitin deacetylase (PgdA/CDA1 family)
MRRVALFACCLAGGAVGYLSAGLTPATAQEAPLETASLSKPAAAPTVPPTAAVPPAQTSAPTAAPVAATEKSCPGVIGTSRTIAADAAMPQHIGLMQYKTSLPLEDHEVVLTFDDGPIHTYTPRVLDVLAANCVKATFFLVGSMAQAYPRLARRIYNEGHSIGTHSQHHPLTFNRMAEPAVAREIEAGIASVQAAVGDPRAVAPFFRVPGLLRSKTVDTYLAAHALTEWSADEVADDWHHGITARQIVRLAMKRIAARDHRGVLLLHDIHPATAEALPMLLSELKAHGYQIVHVIPAGARPKSVPPLPATMVAHAQRNPIDAEHHRHRAHLARHRLKHRQVALHRHRKHRVHLAHAQSLSALAHKKHHTHTAARDAVDTIAW